MMKRYLFYILSLLGTHQAISQSVFPVSSGFMLKDNCIISVDSILAFMNLPKEASILEHDMNWVTASIRLSDYDMEGLKRLTDHLGSLKVMNIGFYMFDSQSAEFSEVLVKRRMDVLRPILEDLLPGKKLEFKAGYVIWGEDRKPYCAYQKEKTYKNKLWVAIL